MEVVGRNVDRLATIEMRMGNNRGRGIITSLYEAAVNKVGGRPLSLVAAERMIEQIKPGCTVVLMAGMAALPPMPYGETDGALGIASLARAVSFGLKALPMFVVANQDMEPTRDTAKAAGLNVMSYSDAKETDSDVAAILPFTSTKTICKG